MPITPAELAQEAAGAVAAGAEAVHLHPRGVSGAESLAPAEAGRLGLPTRIGLEDITTGPEGEPVTGNAELARLALDAWTAARG